MAEPTPSVILNRRIAGTRLRLADVPIWLIGMLVMCLWAAPFVWMVSTSFKPVDEILTKDIEWFPRTIILDNYVKVFELSGRALGAQQRDPGGLRDRACASCSARWRAMPWRACAFPGAT